jgi:hypothetical protein
MYNRVKGLAYTTADLAVYVSKPIHLGFHLCTVLPIVILTIIYNEQTNE